MAQIVEYNKFPTNLYVNKNLIHYDKIDFSDAEKLVEPKYQDDVSLLIGSIFNNVKHLFTVKRGTCITPRQIELCMRKFKYSNVQRLCSNKFDDTLKSETSKMLAAGKPVFVSGFGKCCDGHSWVIDGSQYDGDNWLVYCSWGWSSGYNGYFSTSCFQPDTSEKAYSRRFRLITYDIPDDIVNPVSAYVTSNAIQR